MNLFGFLSRKSSSASVAKDRLKILLSHERGVDSGNAMLIAKLREDILEVVRKHVEIDPEMVKVEMDREGETTLLGIDIEISTQPAQNSR